MKFLIILLAALSCLYAESNAIPLNNEIVVYAVNKRADGFKLVSYTQAQALLKQLHPIKVKNNGEKQTCRVKTTIGSVEALLRFTAATDAQMLEICITYYQDQINLDNPVVSVISNTYYQAINEGQVLFIPAGEVTFVLYLPHQAVSA